jgi:isoprenylcysteine carboxyl methyltransferase (ICMT) family protein YpbQ
MNVWGIENTTLVKLVFFIFFIFLIAERLINTFHPKIFSRKTKKVFCRADFVFLLSNYLAIILASVASFFMQARISLWESLIGGAIFFAGVICRRMAIHALKEWWSVFIEIKEGQRIVREGIYRYFGHPYYLGVLCELSGFVLLCNAAPWISILIVVQCVLLFFRIRIEERVLQIYERRMKQKL